MHNYQELTRSDISKDICPHISVPRLLNMQGTKENPFDNVYEAVEYIRQMEQKILGQDILLQDIEQ